ncbi:MAG: hypothetical protein IT308_03335 [Anaerolineaceae bacterium]|nr:hypothetical protein [Anaerolineaceae bacterium]
MSTTKRLVINLIVIFISLLLVVQSVVPPANQLELIRAYTRDIEFDFSAWVSAAFSVKQKQAALNLPEYLNQTQQTTMMEDCLALIAETRSVNAEIEKLYANPDEERAGKNLAVLSQRLEGLVQQQEQFTPVCETILQQQVNTVLTSMGFTLGGQAIPPVLYHATPLPYALIISPRSIIRQDANISLRTDLTLPEMVALEQEIEKNLNVSALVVPIGGIGVYPTMVLNTSYLPSLVDIVSHEWTHNYLTLRPLGLSYEKSPELRTMNETTASIAEEEIGRAVLEKYYPKYLPEPVSSPPPVPSTSPAPPQPVFDFNAEMHITRVTVDALLKEGKINEAESYMEERRQILLENGYQIRRLNQAYFAFYGAYAAQPGGSSGTDPVGPAVRALRAQSSSLADFVNRISWLTSFEDLQRVTSP